MPGLPIPFGASAAGGFVSYDTTIDTDLPLSHWKLGEGSGPTAFDRKGVNNGTYVGTPTYGVASLLSTNNGADTAITFSGDDKVDLPSLALGAGTDATVEAWFASTATGTDLWMYGEGSTASTTPLFGLILQAGKVRAYWRNNAVQQLDLQTPLTYNDGQRHHAVMVKSGNTLAIYVDGQLVAGPTATPGGAITLNTATIGALRRSTTGQWFNGTLDEVAVYNTALTGTRIGAHYTAGTTSSATDVSGTDAAALSESATVVIITSVIASDDMTASESPAAVAASAAASDANILTDTSSVAGAPAAADAATQAEDPVAVTSTDAKAASDTITQSEGTSTVASQDAKVASDSATQGEDPTVLSADAAANDALTQSEGTSAASAAPAAADTATQSEGTSTVASQDAKSASDSSVFSDSSSLLQTFNLSASDALVLTESSSAIAAALATTDGGAFGDASSLLQTLALAASDASTFTDASSVFVGLSLLASDSFGFSDAAGLAATIAAVETHTLTDVLQTLVASFTRTDGTTFTDVSALAQSLNLSASDAATLAEVASPSVTGVQISASDALTLSESAGLVVQRDATDAFVLSDSGALGSILARTDAFTFIELAEVAGPGFGAPDLRGPLLVIVESVTGKVRVESFGGDVREATHSSDAKDTALPGRVVVPVQTGAVEPSKGHSGAVVGDLSGKVKVNG